MSTQRFEYNGFSVSEGTVAAFPCGTVTAGAELLRASRFSQACDGRGHRRRRPMDWWYANDGRGCRRGTERSGAPRDSFGPASDFRLRWVPSQSGGTYRSHCLCPPRAADQDAFVADGQRVIVAASAFGMGLGKPDVPPQLAHQIID